MNVLSCGGVCRRIMLACSSIILVYLVVFHRDRYMDQEFVSQFSSPIPERSKLGAPKSVHINKKQLPESCTNKNKVVFLKTHKTASSTVQNILMRYGNKVYI